MIETLCRSQGCVGDKDRPTRLPDRLPQWLPNLEVRRSCRLQILCNQLPLKVVVACLISCGAEC